MEQRWVKMPGPGELRGEGQWVVAESGIVMAMFSPGMSSDDAWKYLTVTGYLPTREQAEEPGECVHCGGSGEFVEGQTCIFCEGTGECEE
jgi:hypothetical protein